MIMYDDACHSSEDRNKREIPKSMVQQTMKSIYKECLSAIGACFMLCMIPQTAKAQLIINELMQSNIDCIMDNMNEFPDSWVELYNSGDAAVNLESYKIGISKDASKAWQLPKKEVKAKGYAIIYCDKYATGLHTDFRLESGKGCEVYLFMNDEVVSEISGMKKQPTPNIAYGRKSDGAEQWGYMLSPTPGSTNKGGTSSDILGQPVFSETGRVLTTNKYIRLKLSVPEDSPEGTVIRYTTDGSEPTSSSTLYDGAIGFSDTKVIRAKLFCDGWLSPRSTAQSFIYLNREQTLPVISITTSNEYFYDEKIGIYSDAKTFDGQENYKHDWRRPVNIEMYETDGATCVLNQLCETRIQGGQSRTSPLKSLTLYANKRFGEKRFSYEFFPDQRPGQKNFKSIILRNAGNDFDYLYMRDAVIQRTIAANCDIDWQAWRPAIVYINGIYKGIENIRERANEDNIFSNYNELEDIDLIENWQDLKVGTWDNYNAFKTFYTERGHNMDEYAKWMDVEEFITLMAANLYYCNLDFPGNNIVMWRPRTDDGKWRWIMKDTDFGLGLYGRDVNYNTIEWIYNNGFDSGNAWGNTADATRLFRRLMDDSDFKREFIDHCAIYMGDFMNERGTRELWDPMYEIIKTEYPIHRRLFNQWWPNYNDELNNARKWVKERTDFFYNALAKYYKLGPLSNLKINSVVNADDLANIDIIVNGIKLSKGKLDGKFFQDRTLTLSSSTRGSKKVIGWNITINGETTGELEPVYTFKMPKANDVFVDAIINNATDGIENVISGNTDAETYKYIENGNLYIKRNGKTYNANGMVK